MSANAKPESQEHFWEHVRLLHNGLTKDDEYNLSLTRIKPKCGDNIRWYESEHNQHWKTDPWHVLRKIEKLEPFRSRHGFAEALTHLSVAHALLATNRVELAKQSWWIAMEMLKSRRCEYCLPGFATLWVRRIVKDLYEWQGWGFRMMLPDGRADFTWPPGHSL